MPVKELYQNTYMISLRHGLHGLFYSFLVEPVPKKQIASEFSF